MVTSPHRYIRSNTRSTAHKYATAVDQPCFHSFASSWPTGSGAGFSALFTGFFSNTTKARTQSSGAFLYTRDTMGAPFRRLPLIALAFTGWDSQPLYLAASYFLKRRFPAFAGLADEK
jgi:hypothetical protein